MQGAIYLLIFLLITILTTIALSNSDVFDVNPSINIFSSFFSSPNPHCGINDQPQIQQQPLIYQQPPQLLSLLHDDDNLAFTTMQYYSTNSNAGYHYYPSDLSSRATVPPHHHSRCTTQADITKSHKYSQKLLQKENFLASLRSALTHALVPAQYLHQQPDLEFRVLANPLSVFSNPRSSEIYSFSSHKFKCSQPYLAPQLLSYDYASNALTMELIAANTHRIYSSKYTKEFTADVVALLAEKGGSRSQHTGYFPLSLLYSILYDFTILNAELPTVVDYNLINFNIEKSSMRNRMNPSSSESLVNISVLPLNTNPFYSNNYNSKPVLILLGDTHGQYTDIYNLLKVLGPPTPERQYLFNGDIVDRGPDSLELFLTIMLYKLHCPICVHITRGNHEDSNVASNYGFHDELTKKMTHFFRDDQFLPLSVGITNHLEIIWELFDYVFNSLPLSYLLGPIRPQYSHSETNIPERILVLHGGLPVCNYPDLSDGISIENIRTINRFCSPQTSDNHILLNHRHNHLHYPYHHKRFSPVGNMMNEILWADPRDEYYGVRPSPRGLGCHFGPDTTTNFFAKSNVGLVVRSHEVCANGYKFHHNLTVMTLFSAPHYAGNFNNQGAFVVLDSEYNFQITPFDKNFKP